MQIAGCRSKFSTKICTSIMAADRRETLQIIESFPSPIHQVVHGKYTLFKHANSLFITAFSIVNASQIAEERTKKKKKYRIRTYVVVVNFLRIPQFLREVRGFFKISQRRQCQGVLVERRAICLTYGCYVRNSCHPARRVYLYLEVNNVWLTRWPNVPYDRQLVVAYCTDKSPVTACSQACSTSIPESTPLLFTNMYPHEHT